MKSQSEDYGAVVGWSSTTVGDRVTLHVQSVAKPPPFSKDDVKTPVSYTHLTLPTNREV